MPNLRGHLLQAYGNLANRRFKDPSRDHPIRIDDKGPHDVYLFFCTISARVPDDSPESLILTLQYAPSDSDVVALVEELGGTLHASEHGPTISLTVPMKRFRTIGRLSRAIRKVVGRGRRYSNPNLRWICPRTSDSLDRLVNVLADYKAGRPAKDFIGTMPPP